jgi:hypothetical protein
MQNPISVEGTVVDLQPSNHRSVVISYEVDGRAYSSSTNLSESLGLPRFDDTRIGDKAKVVYNPKYPREWRPG